jgi:hypothetical protein
MVMRKDRIMELSSSFSTKSTKVKGFNFIKKKK